VRSFHHKCPTNTGLSLSGHSAAYCTCCCSSAHEQASELRHQIFDAAKCVRTQLGQLSWYTDWLQAGQSGVQIRAEARYLIFLKTI
jgi:hypothetical protein